MTDKVTESLETNPTRVYGWKRDLPSNQNNFLMVANPMIIANFPKEKFLTELPPVYDQGQLGSCTANALGGAFEFEQMKQNLEVFTPSRLFIYYNERKIEGTIPVDSGAALSDGIKALTDLGACKETSWPYDIRKFTVVPPPSAFKEASDHQILASKRVPMTINGFKTMINMGYPVAFGFTVFPYMESQEMATSGILKLPDTHEDPLGGHAVLCIGYSDTMQSADGQSTGFLKIRNSWGPSWGQQGNFWMPYDYVTARLCSDGWVITENEKEMLKLNKEMNDPIKVKPDPKPEPETAPKEV
jgi:C1A family cysteine protease